MAGYTLITVRGVLARYEDHESPAAAKLVAEGALFYHAMKNVSKIALIIDDPEHVDRLTYWLATHGFKEHVRIYVNPDPDEPLAGRSILLRSARRHGPVDLVVDADPAFAARMLHHGASSFLFSLPEYTRDEFRPGASKTSRPWDELVSEIDAQNEERRSDQRVTADVAGTRYEDDAEL